MKRVSIYIAAGLFLLAATAKLAFPAKTNDTIQTMKEIVNREEAAETASIPGKTSSAPVLVTINAAEFLSAPRQHPVYGELPEAMEKAIMTFLESQSDYEELGIPVNVTYEAPIPEFSYVCPVAAETSSGFGYRMHPLEQCIKFHYGTDLAANSGDDILSFADGIVTEVGSDDSYGNYLVISHADGYSTRYAHCGKVYVHENQTVKAGEKIALVGASGKVTGPHLHFELLKDDMYLNPAFYLAAL